MKFVGITIFVLAVMHSGRAYPPTAYIHVDKPINDLGSTVNLRCQVSNSSLQDYAISWSKIDKKLGNRLISENSTSSETSDDYKISVTLDRDHGTYELRIRDFQEEDEGPYQCKVEVSANESVDVVEEVKVRKLPVFTKNSTSSLVLREGQPMKLECYADGFPEPQFSIIKENNGVLPIGGKIYRGNVLNTDAVSKNDRGTYYCFADNRIDRKDQLSRRFSTKHSIKVEIEFGSVITVPRPRVGQALQFDADLACHVEAYPAAAIFWYKDGIQIPYNDEHYSISNFATDDAVVDSVLRVKKIEKKHYGQYVCKATNKLNSTEAGIELFETSQPICPPACNVQGFQQNITKQNMVPNPEENASSSK